MDESDGSIAQFSPRIAVLNNIALDHKSMDELRLLFRGFVAKAKAAVLNLDNAETAALMGVTKSVTYSLERHRRGYFRVRLQAAARRDRVRTCIERGRREAIKTRLQVPGRHNVANALAALAAARECGATLKDAAQALERFSGIRRRLETAGTRKRRHRDR